jgi:hypothetical protein
MKTKLAVSRHTSDVWLPAGTATVACKVFVSCERVELRDGVLIHSGRHFAVPAEALRFFRANVLHEAWEAA